MLRSRDYRRFWQRPEQIQGLIFDGAIFLANLLFVNQLFASPVEELGDQRIGLLLGLGVLAQLSGALLKKGPLQQRIDALERNRSEPRENLLGCLSFVHFIFFLIAVAMALALVGFIDLNESGGSREFLWVLISFVIAAVTSATVWMAIRFPADDKGQQLWWRYQEIPANLLLWISTVILTRFFWTALLLESEPPTYMGFSGRALLYITAVSLLFMVFYVPARLLFLAEDYRHATTWLRLWLVAMLPLLTVVFLA